MKSSITSSTLAVLAGISFFSQAAAQVTIDWVSVGDPGNSAEPATGSLYGAVGYEYRIGKYEVTNGQYGAFLNAKASTDSYNLYHTSMSSYGITRSGDSGSYTYSVTSGLENRPVVYVSWFDAARFSNWLSNGQGSGDTETGSYTLNGATSGIITANAGAQVYIPTENQWYKAAYYIGANSTYSLYPNGQNTITTADANYNSSGSTDVGTYSGDPSFYGTFDQGGNVFEWNDAVIGLSRGLRGGSWTGDESWLHYWYSRSSGGPSYEANNVGFRVASLAVAAVPEPSGLVLTLLIGAGFVCHRRR